MLPSVEQLRTTKDRNLRRDMIGTPSFEAIDRLFSRFRNWGEEDRRGGILAEYKPQMKHERLEPDGYHRRHTESYHVEMTWTEQQDLYADVALLNLEEMALGVGRHGERVISFHERVVAKTRAKMKAGESAFEVALEESVYDLLDAFAQTYPEWMPAVNAIFAIAGGSGTEVALNQARDMIDAGLTGELTEENIATYENDRVKLGKFAGEHPTTFDEPEEYEIQCTGRTLARKLFVQGRLAGLRASQDPFIRANYVMQPRIATFLMMDDALKRQVRALYMQEATRHQPIAD